MRETAEKIVERADKAQRTKEQWRDIFDQAFQFAFPNSNIFSEVLEGSHKQTGVYDSTLMVSATRFANRIQADLIPPEQKFTKLVPGKLLTLTKQFDRDGYLKFSQALDAVTDAAFAVIHASNFDVSAGESLVDLSISTLTMLANRQRGLGATDLGMEFTPCPLGQIALEMGARGDYSAKFRFNKIPARALEATWPKGFKASDQLKKIIADKPDEPMDVLEATYNKGIDKKGVYYDVIVRQGEKKYETIYQAEYKKDPWIVIPWFLTPGETYGRGPVILALPDARVLNKVKELTLKNASLAIAPPIMAQDDGVINFATISLSPAAIIQVGRNAGALGPSLQPLVLGDNFDVSQIVLNDQKMSVKEILFDYGMPPEQGGVRSATEWITRQTQLLRDIGAPFGRLRRFVREVMGQVLHHLDEAGVIEQIMSTHGFPGTKIDLDGRLVDIELLSPLGQAQKLNDMDSLTAGLQLVGSLGPEVAALSIKLEDIADEVWTKLGLNTALLRSQEDKEQIRQMATQIVAQQMAQGQQIPA